MPGTIHQCQGQEATAVGVCAALRRSDFITSTFRGHGHALAKGLTLEELLSSFRRRRPAAAAARAGRCMSATWTRGWSRASRSSAAAFRSPRAWRWRSRCRRAPGRRLFLRRWRGGRRRLPRGRQHGGDLGPAGDLRLREQPLRRLDADRSRDANARDLRPRRAVWVPGRDRGRQRRRWRSMRPPRSAAAECRAGGGPVLLELLTYRRPAIRGATPATTSRRMRRRSGRRAIPIEVLGDPPAGEGMADRAEIERMRRARRSASSRGGGGSAAPAVADCPA